MNDLIDKGKESSKVIKDFISDLNDVLNTQFNNNIEQEKRNQISLLQKIQNQTPLTTSYRDKMHLERNNILNSYAKDTKEKGTMYYIYSQSSKNVNQYNLCICEEGKSHDIIEVNESNLPANAGVDCVLRIKNGEYILDTKATKEIEKEVEAMVNKLVIQQEKELTEKRKENHLYEVIEKAGDRVWLMDKSDNTGECFEEIIFTKENLEALVEGEIIKYENGKYKVYNNS